MKIAIHDRDNSFSKRWVDYCEKKHIDYKIVNAFSDDIIHQLKDCDAFMWHHHHADTTSRLAAKQILFSIEQSGKIVFPDFNTGWHFDDKLGQKYLLESINAPIVQSYSFFSKQDALDWINATSFPKVFKLRGGAGSSNVILVPNKNKARKLIKKCFGNGFKENSVLKKIKYQYKKYTTRRISLKNFINFSIGATIKSLFSNQNKESGYAYFQDFIPGNHYDIRVVVIGDKAFALKRMCQDKDFRASGSGKIIYNKSEISEECVKLSFHIAERLKTQCIGFDWVFEKNGSPLLIEMSYGFTMIGYDECEGYWTSDMVWHPGSHFDFCGWMVENVIAQLKNEK